MRVVVVDDERLVQLGIQTYLQQASEKYEIGGIFANGEEALHALREQPAEILLTDIKMPVMDGLELIARVRKESLATSIVVLSCHDEFDLVRRAFTSGANEYVLKHEIEQDQLIEVLDRQSGVPHGSEQSRKESRPDSAFGDWSSVDDNLWPGLPLICGTYRFKHHYDENFAIVPWEPVTNALDAEIERVLTQHSPALHVRRPRGPILLFGLRSEEEVEPHRRARRAAQEIVRDVRRYWNREIQIWISTEPHDPGELPILEAQIHAFRETALYTDGDTVTLVPGNSRDSAGASAWPTPPRIHLGDADAPESWCLATASFLEDGRSSQLPPSELRLGISGMLHQIDRDLHRLIGQSLSQTVLRHDGSLDAPQDSLLAMLEYFDDLEILKSWLDHVFLAISDAIAQTHKRRTRLGRILQYIDDQFQQPLRLSELAERFSISRTYLSSLFREETGVTFSQYLNQRRIERAQQLLATTDMNAKEISFKVGYDNPNYFSRVFKAYTGRSVSSYRRTQTGNM